MSMLGNLMISARTAVVAFVVFVAMTVAVATFGAGSAAAASGDRTLVGKVPGVGRMYSKVVGTAGNGDKVTGSFTPIRFVKRNGKVFVRGMLVGTVQRDNGRDRMFSGIERMRVRKINGEPVSARTALRPNCDILNLVLGPLDLDLLGLQVHLDRVVLRIVAASGAGNLLGNLLCAVAGLLDGGLQGLLGRLTRLLNRILGSLGMGI
jgi:hypothetical protein